MPGTYTVRLKNYKVSRIKFTEKYPGEVVRALSWKQPFASLMLHGKHETRTWNTNIRGWVLICASQNPYTYNKALEIMMLREMAHFLRVFDADGKYIQEEYKNIVGNMRTGVALAVGYLSAVKYMGDYIGNRNTHIEIEEKCFVRYNPDLWIHEYTDVQPIVPFEWKGKQSWSILTDEQKDKIILL